MIKKEQKDIVVDIAEHYFKEYAKKTNDYDEFLLKITQEAFENGSEDWRYTFITNVIKTVGKEATSLIAVLAWAYKEK